LPKPPEALAREAPGAGAATPPAAVRPGAPVAGPADAVRAEHVLDLDHGPERALAAVAGAAEDWGADWRSEIGGGRLALPILAGIRHGLVTGRVRIEPRPGGGARVRFQPEQTIYRVQTQAVAILLFAAGGALLTVLWPFYPDLLAAAPLGAVIALSGWFLVVSRLRTSGPDDFLALVAEVAKGEEAATAEAPADGG
jgi:hypothetical protein